MTQTLHRIAEDVVVAEVTAAGFTLDRTADFLRNPDDPRDWNDAPSAAAERTGTSDRGEPLASADRPGDEPDGRYQLAFMIPGSLPSSASVRNAIRDSMNLRYTAFGRPLTMHRVFRRTGEELRGSLASASRAVWRSSGDSFGSRALRLSSSRRAANRRTSFSRFFCLLMELVFAM